MKRLGAWMMLAGMLVAGLAVASSVVDQGRPGNEGPWPVTCSNCSGGGGSGTDAGTNTVITSVLPCKTLVQSVTSVGPVATAVPASPLVSRTWIQICNGVLNASSLQCICETSAKPTFAASSAGDTLNTGDCATYPVADTDGGQPWCLCNADAGTSFLVSSECQPF